MGAKDLVRVNSGYGKVTGLEIIWSVVKGGELNAVTGEKIWNPYTQKSQRLFGEPEYTDLELTGVWTEEYVKLLDAWYQKNKEATNIVFVGQIGTISFRFVNCSIKGVSSFPGFDKDGAQSQVSAHRVRMTLAPGGIEKL